jgi:hypothetical protein
VVALGAKVVTGKRLAPFIAGARRGRRKKAPIDLYDRKYDATSMN